MGKRGEGKWQRISFEQLIKEVVEGGDLFGEGHVDGFTCYPGDLATPIDPKQPALGPKSANQLLVTNAGDDGRDSFIRRFCTKCLLVVKILGLMALIVD